MESSLYDPFLEATRNVFQLMLDLSEVTEGPAESLEGEDELDISIGVIGDLKGEIVYRFPRDTSLSMVNIMSGMEVDTVDDFVTSAISEITNIISGNALMALAEGNVNCDILPPVIKQATKSSEYAIHTDFCIRTSAGDICLDIRLNPAS